MILPWRYTMRLPWRLDKKLLKKHSLLLGKTGCGKSQLLLTIGYNLIKKWKSVIIIDPHGSLVEQALQFDHFHKNPQSFIYLDPTLDRKHRLGINSFYKAYHPLTAELYADWWTYAFLRLLGNHSLSLQMETLLKPALIAIFCHPKADFETLQQLFILEADDPIFQNIIASAPDITQRFLQEWFHNPRFGATRTAITIRLQHYMNYSVLHELFNGKQTIDIGEELAKGKSLLINLSKSNLWNEVSTILGKFLMSHLLGIFFGKQHKTKETYLLIDEAHLLADRTLASLVTELRKKGLFFIGASQSISQFSTTLKKRLLNNIGVLFLGKHYDSDMNDFTKHMNIKKEVLQELRPYHFIVKTEESSPFVMRSPKGLLGKSSRMYRQSKQIKELIDKQLKKHYQKRSSQNNAPQQKRSLTPKF